MVVCCATKLSLGWSQTPDADGRTRDETAEPADEAADLHLDGCSLHYGVYKSQQLEIILAHCITNAVPAFSFCCCFSLCQYKVVFFQSLFWINLGLKAEIIKATTYVFLYMFLN